jgi:hypothetical protein
MKLNKKLKEGLVKMNGLIIKKRWNWKKKEQLFASNIELQVKDLLKLKKQRLGFERPRCDSMLLKWQKDFLKTPQKPNCSRQNTALKDQCLTERNAVDLELPDDANYNNLVSFTERLKDNFIRQPLAQEVVKKPSTRPIRITEKLKLINQSLSSLKVKAVNNERNLEKSSIKSTAHTREEKKAICFNTKYNVQMSKIGTVHFSESTTSKSQPIARKKGCGLELRFRTKLLCKSCIKRLDNLGRVELLKDVRLSEDRMEFEVAGE